MSHSLDLQPRPLQRLGPVVPGDFWLVYYSISVVYYTVVYDCNLWSSIVVYFQVAASEALSHGGATQGGA